MACGVSAACRGPLTERQKFIFKVFDRDRDGLLSRQELEAMIAALLALSAEDEGSDTGKCTTVLLLYITLYSYDKNP